MPCTIHNLCDSVKCLHSKSKPIQMRFIRMTNERADSLKWKRYNNAWVQSKCLQNSCASTTVIAWKMIFPVKLSAFFVVRSFFLFLSFGSQVQTQILHFPGTRNPICFTANIVPFCVINYRFHWYSFNCMAVRFVFYSITILSLSVIYQFTAWFITVSLFSWFRVFFSRFFSPDSYCYDGTITFRNRTRSARQIQMVVVFFHWNVRVFFFLLLLSLLLLFFSTAEHVFLNSGWHTDNLTIENGSRNESFETSSVQLQRFNSDKMYRLSWKTNWICTQIPKYRFSTTIQYAIQLFNVNLHLTHVKHLQFIRSKASISFSIEY